MSSSILSDRPHGKAGGRVTKENSRRKKEKREAGVRAQRKKQE
jgi:hypothetical protein